MKKFRMMLTIACMAFVMMVTRVRVQAISGKGTQSDPYVITEYMEFPEYATQAQNTNRKEVYFRLGADLECLEPYSGSKKMISVGGINGNYSTMYLDLAGHRMDVKIYDEAGLFYIDHGKLVINDTVGGGYVEVEAGDYVGTPRMPVFAFGDAGGPGMGLEINGGTYRSLSKEGRCVRAENFNGSITIYDGNFKSEIVVCNMDPQKPSKITIYDGDFFDFYYCSWSNEDITARIRSTKEMNRSRWMAYVNPSSDHSEGIFKKILDPNTTVYVNGKEIDLSRVTGGIAENHVEFRDPTKPRIVSQPVSYVFPYVGSSHEFEIAAENAEYYDWRLMDENGIELSWDDVAMKCGAWSENHYSNKFTLKGVDPWLNGKRLYCVVRGNDYRIRSDYVTLQVEPVIKLINAEPDNYAELFAGGNISDFRKINLDCQSHATAMPANWFLYYEEQEGKIQPYENYTIRFEVELEEGYSFDSKVRCIVKTPKGDVVATRLAGSNETHANYEFSYEPPLPENGIKIESVSRSVKEPVAGEAPAVELDPLSGAEAADCPYVVQSMTWNPSPESFVEGGQYVLIIVYKAKDGYGFYDDTEFFMNGNKMIVDEIVKGSGGTAKVVSFIKAKAAFKITKKSLTLYDTIAIDFKVPKESMEGYHDPFLLVTMNNEVSRITEYSEDGELYKFTYRVAPHHMGDKVTAVPHALNASGADVAGEASRYSVAEYCYNMLNKEDYQGAAYAKLRRLLVDILLYGDAAQNYVGYKTNALAGANLTAAQRAMGTDVTAQMSYQSVKDKLFATVDEADALASIELAALYLESAVNVQFKYVAENLSGLRVVVTDDPEGMHVLGEYAADGNLIDNKGRYYVTFGNLNAGQMRKTIYATVMKGSKKVSNTYRYSIESYVASMRTANGTNLDKLLDAMMRYGDSAADFAGNK